MRVHPAPFPESLALLRACLCQCAARYTLRLIAITLIRENLRCGACNPVEILGDEDGRVCGMKCVRMELGEPDASGRRRPIEVPNSEFVLDVDTVIMALGTSPNPLIRSTTPGLDTNKKGCLVVDENEMTTREGVFAGGDAVTGAATVILAMGAGKKGAAAIDAYLSKK